ncbi:uncharacterized protein ASPGLDRAFT_80256 [Aspergillus glaucus CBS 516.65]|uniref:Uncharacterized protein n=1 Tax=Aspergillus glaucus CBS 516.65 TaxID=1160497 RepID=A0A1L9VU27_ASPGL|nr:hypothetical protein ASPGLDRAFT_80256 [Aspergillus glaucus CBS 516.65]OJJ87433.1 hypothetical protein ASPGLDRAFT_80256 [Aspergillus glaucus CBS 516.65]
MSRTEIEIQSILSTLNFLYWRYTDPFTRITHKPYGIDCIYVESSVYRLLVLRGTITMGEKVSEDPWDLYLNEYAPAGTRRLTSSGQNQGQVVQSPITIPSTTSASTTTASYEGQGRGRQLANCDGQQQQQQSQRRVRFLDTPSPARGRAPRRLPLSPAPNARFH